MLSIHGVGLSVTAKMPAVAGALGLTMCEKRVQNRAQFLALSRHHVNRIVQQRRADFPGCFSHKDARIRLPAHEHRQGSDMILMGVADENRVNCPSIDRFPAGQSSLAVIFWMHAAIQNQPFATSFEVIRVRADLSPARQVDKFHENDGLAFYCNGSRTLRLLIERASPTVTHNVNPGAAVLSALDQNTGVHGTTKSVRKFASNFGKGSFRSPHR